MVTFLSAYIVILALFTAYAFRKVRQAFALHGGGLRGTAAAMAALTVIHVTAHLLEHEGHLTISRYLSWAGDSWLLFLCWFVCAALVIDGWNGAGWLVGRLTKHAAAFRRARILPQLWVIPVMLVMAVAYVYGWREAQRPQWRSFYLLTDKLPAGASFRLFFVSDIHLGAPNSRARLQRLADYVQQANPDCLLVGGDVLDSRAGQRDQFSQPLGQISLPLGKFAVLGNHDLFSGVEGSLKFLHQAGFRVLRGEWVDLAKGGAKIRIAGLDDPLVRIFDPGAVKAHIQWPDDGIYTVGLLHPPNRAAGGFDLQLSGHTHAGQIFPFQRLVKRHHRQLHGLFENAPGQWLYVSSGWGTWGPPIRLMAPPEAVLFVIEGTGTPAAR
jgi:predicted MPP superfamily phosphohydrolase